MSTPNSTDERRCPRCEELLPATGICAPCILRDALARGAEQESTADRASTPFQRVGIALAVPSQMGDYVIHERIGEGAMGVVHRAYKRSLRKEVAIKFLKAGMEATGRQRALFLREAQLASHLDHPNIITVSEVGELDGGLYLVMKLVEGPQLAAKLQEPDFCPTVRSRVELLRQIVRAVHFAHQRGVIHRDLKPGNILIDPAGAPAVGDFGLARWLAQDSTVTVAEGAVIGTPAFMPPEHAGANREDPTVAGDVWSLGVILYLLLSGRLPFDAPSLGGVVHKILTEHPAGPFRRGPAGALSGNGGAQPPRDADRLSAAARRDLESVCLRCLEKKPGARYASAGELADELDRWLSGVPVLARPAGGAERAVRWLVRRPATAALIALGVVAFSGVLLGLWQRQVNLRTERMRAVFNYVADMNLAQRGLRESNAVLFERAMAAAVPAPGAEDFRGIEWGLLRHRAAAVFQPSWYDAGEPLYDIALAAESGEVAVIGARHVMLLGADGQLRARWTVDTSDSAAAVAVDAQGSRVMAGTLSGVRIFRPGAGEGEVLGEGRVVRMALSKDATRLAVVTRPSLTNDNLCMDLFALPEGRLLQRVNEGPDALCWMPDGRLRFANYRAEVSEWDPASLGVQKLRPPGYLAPSAVFVRGGEGLIRSSYYGALHHIDLASGTARTAGMEYPGKGTRMACSPDGEVLAAAALGGRVNILRVGDSAGGGPPLVVVPGHAASPSGLALSRDGSDLFTCSMDGTVRRATLPPSPTPVQAVVDHRLLLGNGIPATFSRDGGVIALLSSRSYMGSQQDESTVFWDTEKRRVVGQIPAEVVAWGPDRKFLSWDVDARLRVWDGTDPSAPKELAAFRLNRNQQLLTDTKVAGHDRWLVSLSGDASMEAYDVARDVRRVLRATDLPARESFRGSIRPGTRPEATSPGSQGKVLFTKLDAAPYAPVVVAELSDGRVIVWWLEENRVVPIVRVTTSVQRLDLEGRRLALMEGSDRGVSIYDTRQGRLLGLLVGHEASLTTLAFSPDGRQVVTGGADNLLVIWDLESGREVFREAQPFPLAWVRVSPDARWLVATHLPEFHAEEGKPRDGVHRLHPMGWDRRAPVPPTASARRDTVWERFEELARLYPATGSNMPPVAR